MQKQPIMIVMELVPGGSLLTYLRNSGPTLNPKCLLGKRFIILPTQDLQIGDHQKTYFPGKSRILLLIHIFQIIFFLKFKLIHFFNSNFIFHFSFIYVERIPRYSICYVH